MTDKVTTLVTLSTPSGAADVEDIGTSFVFSVDDEIELVVNQSVFLYAQRVVGPE